MSSYNHTARALPRQSRVFAPRASASSLPCRLWRGRCAAAVASTVALAAGLRCLRAASSRDQCRCVSAVRSVSGFQTGDVTVESSIEHVAEPLPASLSGGGGKAGAARLGGGSCWRTECCRVLASQTLASKRRFKGHARQ